METNFQILASKLDAIASSLQAINQTLIGLQNHQLPLPIVDAVVTPPPTTLFQEPKEEETLMSLKHLRKEFPNQFKQDWDVYRLQRKNLIPHYRLGGRLRFKKSEIVNWLNTLSPEMQIELMIKPRKKRKIKVFSELTKIV